MASHSPETSSKSSSMLDAVELTASSTSLTGISTLNFEWCKVTINVGAATGTSPTMDIKMQSATTSGGAYSDITSATFTQFTDSRDSGVYVGRVKVSSASQFIRPHITIAGTTPVFPVAITAELSGPRESGRANDNYNFTV